MMYYVSPYCGSSVIVTTTIHNPIEGLVCCTPQRVPSIVFSDSDTFSLNAVHRFWLHRVQLLLCYHSPGVYLLLQSCFDSTPSLWTIFSFGPLPITGRLSVELIIKYRGFLITEKILAYFFSSKLSLLSTKILQSGRLFAQWNGK
jgi:hypothetical protein